MPIPEPTATDLIGRHLSTAFQGGIFVTLLAVTWRGATFVQWVRGSLVRIEMLITNVDKKVDGVNGRVDILEKAKH